MAFAALMFILALFGTLVLSVSAQQGRGGSCNNGLVGVGAVPPLTVTWGGEKTFPEIQCITYCFTCTAINKEYFQKFYYGLVRSTGQKAQSNLFLNCVEGQIYHAYEMVTQQSIPDIKADEYIFQQLEVCQTNQCNVVNNNKVCPRPTEKPTARPTPAPSSEPVSVPTPAPSSQPVSVATPAPSSEPVSVPTPAPSSQPVSVATPAPSSQPVSLQTALPSPKPSFASFSPAPSSKSGSPTLMPTVAVPAPTVRVLIPSVDAAQSSNGQPTSDSDESKALCDYYASLPPQGRAQLTNWCGGRDASGAFVNGTCSENSGAWLGVTCSRTGVGAPDRVTDLNLDGLALGGGRIPTSIGNLGALTLLRLSASGLTGSIPEALGRITGLEQLWLGSNPRLTGPVPSGLVRSSRERANSLVILHLSSTGITGAIPQSFCRLNQAIVDLRLLHITPGITCIPQCMTVKNNWPYMRLDPNIANICTEAPTTTPTLGPTDFPTAEPTLQPSDVPTFAPTSSSPSIFPTFEPTTSGPTLAPSPRPSRRPTEFPTAEPTAEPTTLRPTRNPSARPTPAAPTPEPSETPTWAPFVQFGDEFVLCNYYKSLPVAGQKLLTNWCGPRAAHDGDYSPPACGPKDELVFGQNVWVGVTCCIYKGRDRVCDVNLPNIGLGPGTIPANIGNLEALTYLNLMGTGLAGTVPTSLATISDIQQIWLSVNPLLTGPLPSLGSPIVLSKLRNLHLSKTSLGYSGTGVTRFPTRLPQSLCNLTSVVTLRTINDPGFVCYPKCLSPGPPIGPANKKPFYNFVPDKVPVCSDPTMQPTDWPSFEPTLRPSHRPSRKPTLFPTTEPTTMPSHWPSRRPTELPTVEPSLVPTSAMPTGNSQYSDESILCQFYATLPVGNVADATTGVRAYGQGALTNWCQGKNNGVTNYNPTVCSRDGNSKTAWTGVTCCYSIVGAALIDRVCDINLFNHNLGPGYLPATIGGLDALTYLNVRKTGITGPWPEQMGSIGGMQQIWLSDNGVFNGTIPLDFGSLAPMKKLFMLHMTRTALSGPMPSSMCRLGAGSGSVGRSLDLRTQWDPLLGCYPPCLEPETIFFNFRPSAQQSMCAPPSARPTLSPTPRPSRRPSNIPTTEPTIEPTPNPTQLPTFAPTSASEQSDGDILCCYYDTMNKKEKLRLTNWCGPKNKNGHYITGPCSDEGWLGVTCQRPTPKAPDRVTDLNLPNFGTLRGHLPPCIGGLDALTYLNVRSTYLGESLPSELGNLRNLQQLWVGDNPVTGTFPESLGNLKNLTTLYLSNMEYFTGPVPSTLCRPSTSLPSFSMFDLRILGDKKLECYPSCLLASRIFRRELPSVTPMCDSPAPTATPSIRVVTARPTEVPTPEPSATTTPPPTLVAPSRVSSPRTPVPQATVTEASPTRRPSLTMISMPTSTVATTTSVTAAPSNTVTAAPSNTVTAAPSNTVTAAPSNTVTAAPSNTTASAPAPAPASPSTAPSISAVIATMWPTSSIIGGASLSSPVPTVTTPVPSLAPSSSAGLPTVVVPATMQTAPSLQPSKFTFLVSLPTLPFYAGAPVPETVQTAMPTTQPLALSTPVPSFAPTRRIRVVTAAPSASTGTGRSAPNDGSSASALLFTAPPSSAVPTLGSAYTLTLTPTTASDAQAASSSSANAAGTSNAQLGIGIGVGVVVLVVIAVIAALVGCRSSGGKRSQTISQLLAAVKADKTAARPHGSTGRDSSFMHHDVYNPTFACHGSLEMSSPISRPQSSSRPSSRLHHASPDQGREQRHFAPAPPQLDRMPTPPVRSLSPGVRVSTRI